MNAAAKIDQLLEITGTPPERRAIARKNYAKLLEEHGEKAIDDRLAEFRAMHDDVASWRVHRNKVQQPEKVKSATQRDDLMLIFLNHLAREKLLVRRLEKQIDTLTAQLDHLHTSDDTIDFSQIDEKMREYGFHGSKPVAPVLINYISPTEMMAYCTRVYDAITGKTNPEPLGLYSSRIDEVLRLIGKGHHWTSVATHKNRIDTDQAISGLGRIAAYANELVPDAIFTLNPGGDAIGAFITKHLGLKVPLIPLVGNSAGVRASGEQGIPISISKPLVVDDVARSGGTLSKAFDWIIKRYPNVHPRATTIAASVDAIELVGQTSLLTSNPTEHGSIELPYDPHAGFAIKERDDSRVYIFGANASTPEDRLIVSTEIVDKIVAEQGRRISGT